MVFFVCPATLEAVKDMMRTKPAENVALNVCVSERLGVGGQESELTIR